MILSFTSAVATIKDTINSSLDVLTSATTNCGDAITSQSLIIDGCDNVVVKDFSQDQITTIDQSCMSSNETQQKAANEITLQFKQAAEAVASALSFGDAVASKSAVETTTNLGTSITAAFVTNCPDAIVDQTIKIADCKNAVVEGVSQSQISNIMQTCTSANKSVQEGTNTVLKTIDNKAKAEQQGLLGGLAGLIAVLLIVGLLIFGGSVKMIVVLVCLALVVVAVLSVVFYIKQWWPYATLLATDPEYAAKKKANTTGLLITSGIGGAAIVVLIIMGLFSGGKKTPAAAAAPADAAAATPAL